MVERKNGEAVMYASSETGFGSLRIVKRMDHLVYIREIDMEEED